MARKTTENGDDGEPFPLEDYWEEWIDSCENEIADDPLGSDHVGRFAAIGNAIRAGHVDPVEQSAVVEREQIADLIKPLCLDDPDPVTDQLWQLAGRHLRPLHRKLLGSDPASTAKQLKQVTRVAATLEQLVDEIPPVTRDFLEECYVRLPRRYQAGDKLRINALELTLSDLAHTTYFAALTLTRERKQPPKILRRMTLKRVVEVVESVTGQPVNHTWKKDDQKAVFKGVSGKVVRDFMKLVEPRARERSLIEDLIKMRHSRTSARVNRRRGLIKSGVSTSG